jgi:pseudouridylate synthase
MDDVVALESTLLAHGVPRGEGMGLARELSRIVEAYGVRAAVVGVYRGRGVVGLSEAQLEEMLGAESLPKASSANLGVFLHRGQSAATTVSATMELCAATGGGGVRVFATGGLGGVHRGLMEAGARLDISADLGAFARYPVAVVASGVKSILDVESTRELLETLAVPVVGFGTDVFPAFYLRESGARVDARFDAVEELARFVAAELARTGRGVLVCNPIAREDELDRGEFEGWLREAEGRARTRHHRLRADDGGGTATGGAVTPRVLAALHEVSGGATLRANVALVKANAALAARLCAAMRTTRAA